MVSADDNAPEQAREVEVLVTAVVAHQRVPSIDWPGMSQCSGCDHLYGEPDGPNSPRVVQHQVEVALAALAPIRAAERQEAARAAAEAAWVDGYTTGWFSGGGGEGFFDPTVETNPYRPEDR